MKFMRRIFQLLAGIFIMSALVEVQNVKAEIASDQAFENASWDMILDQTKQETHGIVQSICCTNDYIICIENISDSPDDLDVVYYYYKNDVDENHNPVEQYSLAKTITNGSYEHANGMAYNPNTNEIAISLYVNMEGEENRGAVYIMDASSFDLKRKVKISDDYNILGIGYLEDRNQYVIQTNWEGNYSFKILDSDFQVVEDLGEYADTAEGDNFQDLCVDGDYIMNFPLTLGLGIGDYIHMYSISERKMVAANPLNFGFEGVSSDEPESLCETAPGEFVAVVNVNLDDGTHHFRFYKTVVPYLFSVTTSVDHGTISNSRDQLERGENCSVLYEPAKHYKIESVTVDGEQLDNKTYRKGYTFNDLQANHKINVKYMKMTLMERIPTVVKVIIIVMIVLLATFAFYLRLLYVRRMRIIKKRRAARARRVIEEYQRMDSDEM